MASLSRTILTVITAVTIGVSVVGCSNFETGSEPVATAVVKTPTATVPADANTHEVSYVLMPHPDDEMQAWSLIQNTPDNYKVFVYATRGEETGYCDTAKFPLNNSRPNGSVQPGELMPSPEPSAMWTSSCTDARESSTVDFINAMSKTDPTIPGNFENKFTVTLPATSAQQKNLCRVDDGVKSCGLVQRQVDVFLAKNGYGAIMFFNLGDGDLQPSEVVWAMNSVLHNRSALYINATLPNLNILGPFYNSGEYSCFSYPHPDHKAVQEAMYDTDFPVQYRAAATCADNPEVKNGGIIAELSPTVVATFSDTKGDIGAHVKYYGWLMNVKPGYPEGHYPLATGTNQNALFMTTQSFWVRKS